MKTYKELVDGIKELKKGPYIKTRRTGDTGIGHTLEYNLGVKESNFKGPDGKKTELKGARNDSSSMLTLFTKSPLPRGVNSKLRHEYGYRDENFPNKKVLRTTVNAINFNTVKGKKGFKIITKANRLELEPARPPKCFIDMPNPYWPKEELEKRIREKYAKNLLYVKADSRGKGKEEEFHFNEAWLLQGFDPKKLFTLLKKGILDLDIRLGLYDDGRYHDHGTGIRIQPALLDKCFSHRKQVV